MRHSGFCAQNGKEFHSMTTSDSSKSWKKSSEEINRMLEHIEKLTPHQMKDTLSLNASRKLIVSLTKPLADIAQLIQTNIAVVKDKENEIKTCDAKKKELEDKLNIVAVEMAKKDLKFLRTVCPAPKCVEFHPIPNTNQSATAYIKHFHPHLRIFTKAILGILCGSELAAKTKTWGESAPGHVKVDDVITSC